MKTLSLSRGSLSAVREYPFGGYAVPGKARPRRPCLGPAALLLSSLLALVGAPSLSARTPLGDGAALGSLPENWEARSLMRDTIFAPVRDAAAMPPRVIRQTESTAEVSFRADLQEGAAFLVFSNRSARGFRLDNAGTFIIKRSLADGSFIQAKVFVQNDPGCFLRIFPQADRTVMDVVLYGLEFQTHVLLPARFETLLTAPFSRIVDLSRTSVDWRLVLSPEQGPGDARIAAIVDAVRSRLHQLRDMDDGAMDAAGRLVFIATGERAPAGRGGFNCSGFAKWIIDGFYAPLTGSLTDISELRSRDSDQRGTAWSARYEEEQDPYFGLDWSRGLGRALQRERSGVMPGPDALDVRDSDRIPWLRDVGYPVGSLRALLYFEARQQAGTFYLGSVNARAKGAPAGSSPLLRRHHHVVVLFPWFDANGDFRLVVMERNKETSAASLASRYPDEYVNLVRVDSNGTFFLPEPR